MYVLELCAPGMQCGCSALCIAATAVRCNKAHFRSYLNDPNHSFFSVHQLVYSRKKLSRSDIDSLLIRTNLYSLLY